MKLQNCPFALAAQLQVLPAWSRAVIAALDLHKPDLAELKSLSQEEWRSALDFCDRSRLTLALRNQARQEMPDWVGERTDRDAANNRERLGRLKEIYRTVGRELAQVEFVALKGISQTALSGEPPDDRVQYDIDLYVPEKRAMAARDILLGCGYESLTELEDFPTDHLPALIQKTGWEWRGDFFDPQIPAAIEVHFRFWNPETERLPACGAEEFWERRVTREIAGLELPVLHPADALAYTALHVLRHLLRGNVDAFSVYELALILERHSQDEGLWRLWRSWHSPELRRLQAVSFQLARSWFQCEAGLAAEETIDALPVSAKSWFETFAASPLNQAFRPNKDEVWLHWSLLESVFDRWSVARRRLLPVRLPGPVDAVYVPDSDMTWRRIWIKRLRYGAYLARRMRHHVSALPRTAGAGARWWLRTRRWSGQPK